MNKTEERIVKAATDIAVLRRERAVIKAGKKKCDRECRSENDDICRVVAHWEQGVDQCEWCEEWEHLHRKHRLKSGQLQAAYARLDRADRKLKAEAE